MIDVDVCKERGREGEEGLLLMCVLQGPSTTANALVGQKAPACLFINHNDHAYAKVALDHVSFAYLKDHVEKFPDNMFRQLVWSAFANMVRDAQVPAQEFLELVEK